MSLEDIVFHHLQYSLHRDRAAAAAAAVLGDPAALNLVADQHRRFIYQPPDQGGYSDLCGSEKYGHVVEFSNDFHPLINSLSTTSSSSVNTSTSTNNTNEGCAGSSTPSSENLPDCHYHENEYLDDVIQPAFHSTHTGTDTANWRLNGDDDSHTMGAGVVSNSSGDNTAAVVVNRRSMKRNRRSSSSSVGIVRVPVTETKGSEAEVENQRRVHIALERNRRKQMNHFLAVLRSLMPASLAPRRDQASIVGGAINFVRELEQKLQYLEAHLHANTYKRAKLEHHHHNDLRNHHPEKTPPTSIFSKFFNFPQYSTMKVTKGIISDTSSDASPSTSYGVDHLVGGDVAATADVEVVMVDHYVSVKVLLKRTPKQLLQLLLGLTSLHMSILHLNVTSVESLALYSLSLKVEDECQMNSIKEIATAVYELTKRVQDEQDFT